MATSTSVSVPTLSEAEARINGAVGNMFVEAACALLDIHVGGLYKEAGFGSFTDYVNASTWLGMGVRQAQSWVAAARFIRALPVGSKMPVCERQVRPLVCQETHEAVQAWALAWERASCGGNRRVSGSLVHQCLQEVKGMAVPEALSASDTRVGDDEPPFSMAATESVGDGGVVAGRPVFLLSRSCEWYSPVEVLDRVRRLFGSRGIDLDPCSSAAANTRVGARVFISADRDGLSDDHPWSGNVYMNPPFGTLYGRSTQGLFFDKCAREYRAGRIDQAVLLLKAGIGYAWFKSVLEWPVCFISSRLSFARQVSQDAGQLQWGAGIQNPHGSVIVYMGPEVDRFVDVFGDMGGIPGANSWAYLPTKPTE